MRWLLVKDLQILRRSPLQAARLVVYPILIALLVGFAISRSPGKPRVAFLNQVPQNTPFEIGSKRVDIVGTRNTLCQRIECVRVHTRQQAIDEVKSGDVLGALILPPDLVSNLQSRKPASLEICTAFRKPDAAKMTVPVKYVGLELPDEFVVGYGLDYAEKYRNLRCVASLAPHVYS